MHRGTHASSGETRNGHMMAANPSRQHPRVGRSTPQPRLRLVANPKSKRVQRSLKPPLVLGTLAALAIWFVVVGLFGMHVQTQTKIDDINRENTELGDNQAILSAQRARFDAPNGLTDTATNAGFVLSTEVPLLGSLPPGQLNPPTKTDPFSASSASAANR